MQKHLINFEDISWVEAGKGVRYKAFKSGIQQIRLVEFSEGFVEKDWCLRGHAGYVLEGNCIIDFNGEMEQFETGNIIFISKGDGGKHKVIMNKGERVLLLLFEMI
jgi:quercetin dioxygenase-like cupin family protein